MRPLESSKHRSKNHTSRNPSVRTTWSNSSSPVILGCNGRTVHQHAVQWCVQRGTHVDGELHLGIHGGDQHINPGHTHPGRSATQIRRVFSVPLCPTHPPRPRPSSSLAARPTVRSHMHTCIHASVTTRYLVVNMFMYPHTHRHTVPTSVAQVPQAALPHCRHPHDPTPHCRTRKGRPTIMHAFLLFHTKLHICGCVQLGGVSEVLLIGYYPDSEIAPFITATAPLYPFAIKCE